MTETTSASSGCFSLLLRRFAGGARGFSPGRCWRAAEAQDSSPASKAIAVVSGAAQGLGKAISLRFADSGLAVAINKIALHVKITELRGVQAEIIERASAWALPWGGIVVYVVNFLGGIDLIVANASICPTASVLDWIASSLQTPVRPCSAINKPRSRWLIRVAGGGSWGAPRTLGNKNVARSAVDYIGQPEDVAGLGSDLISKELRYMTSASSFSRNDVLLFKRLRGSVFVLDMKFYKRE
ncbi:hypothetical protein EDD18DRAFT_1335736 [Armillaria luteobubalina]|uniref:NAD(P)-binding protein n=1 Tax=Armillaria luteobubalina TaxID=153913 RepID=A0AA39PNA2_9AGAR|nr:hypothetical protein EDD18DRAFT_1335736 [Armillaria luteobubalina]